MGGNRLDGMVVYLLWDWHFSYLFSVALAFWVMVEIGWPFSFCVDEFVK